MDRSLGRVRKELVGRFRAVVEGDARWPMFLYGAAGVGKTRGCLALCDHVPNSCFCVLEEVTKSVLARSDGWLWRLLPDYNLVVVDELATRSKASDLEYTTLKHLVDAREDLPAIYISNVSPDDISRVYDDRIASRVLCGTVVCLEDNDRRRE